MLKSSPPKSRTSPDKADIKINLNQLKPALLAACADYQKFGHSLLRFFVSGRRVNANRIRDLLNTTDNELFILIVVSAILGEPCFDFKRSFYLYTMQNNIFRLNEYLSRYYKSCDADEHTTFKAVTKVLVGMYRDATDVIRELYGVSKEDFNAMKRSIKSYLTEDEPKLAAIFNPLLEGSRKDLSSVNFIPPTKINYQEVLMQANKKYNQKFHTGSNDLFDRLFHKKGPERIRRIQLFMTNGVPVKLCCEAMYKKCGIGYYQALRKTAREMDILTTESLCRSRNTSDNVQSDDYLILLSANSIGSRISGRMNRTFKVRRNDKESLKIVSELAKLLDKKGFDDERDVTAFCEKHGFTGMSLVMSPERRIDKSS